MPKAPCEPHLRALSTPPRVPSQPRAETVPRRMGRASLRRRMFRPMPAAMARSSASTRSFTPSIPVPLVSLDQRSTWHPDASAADGTFMQWWLNAATVLGWLMSSIFVLSLAASPGLCDARSRSRPTASWGLGRAGWSRGSEHGEPEPGPGPDQRAGGRLGTWRRFEAAAAAGRHRELIDAASAAGIRLFNTSPMYGEAERLLADALGGQRDQVVIATRFWTRHRRRARPSSPAR